MQLQVGSPGSNNQAGKVLRGLCLHLRAARVCELIPRGRQVEDCWSWLQTKKVHLHTGCKKNGMIIFLVDGGIIITRDSGLESGEVVFIFLNGYSQHKTAVQIQSLKFIKVIGIWFLNSGSITSEPWPRDPSNHFKTLLAFIWSISASRKELLGVHISAFGQRLSRILLKIKKKMFSNRTWLKKPNIVYFPWYLNIMFCAPPAGHEAIVSIYEHPLAEQHFLPKSFGVIQQIHFLPSSIFNQVIWGDSKKSRFSLHTELWGEHGEPHGRIVGNHIPALLAWGTAESTGHE